MTEAFLALDQGGHGSRALLVSADDGCILAIHEDQVPIHAFGARAEQDAQALLDSLRRVIARACAEPALRIVAAGLATQRSPVVCWRASTREPISPVFGWQDRRAADMLPTSPETIAEIERRTGLVANAHYGATKLRWSLEHIEAVAQAERTRDLAAGPLAAFLTQGLTRSKTPCVDAINASRTLLLSRDTCNWDPWLLELFGVPEAILPEVRPALAEFGALQACDIPLRLVTGDQAAVPFAFGTPDDAALYLNLGTGAFLQRVPGPEHVAPPLLENPLPAAPFRALEGTVNGAASALDAHADSMWKEQLGALPRLQADAPLFVNGVGGLGSPDWRHDLRSHFTETPADSQRAAIVVESIAFLVRRNLDAMNRQHPPPNRIIASGGLARADVLCQMLADLCALPVLRPPSIEATALGLAVLLGAPASNAESSGCRHFCAKDNSRLEQRFRRWSEALSSALQLTATGH